MNWLDSFKIALIEEDGERMVELLDSLPAFDRVEEAESALRLIDQAKTMLESKKIELGEQMRDIENEKSYLTSSQSENTALLDLYS